MVDRDRGSVCGELQQVDVVDGELPRHERADVEDADDAAAHEQRHAEQRLDPFLPQDRVEHVRVVDVVEDHRPRVAGDASREAAPERDAHALLDLLLDPDRRARDELLRLLVEQQDRARVAADHLPGPAEQRVEQVLELEVPERGVGQGLEPAQALRIANQVCHAAELCLESAVAVRRPAVSGPWTRSACSPWSSRSTSRPSPSRPT